MSTHIPNRVMQNSNRIVRLDVRHLPTAQQAVNMYQQEQQGRISDDSGFGQDPIHANLSKTSIRAQVFGERFPSLEVIFHELVNENPVPFKNGLIFYIDVTRRLSRS